MNSLADPSHPESVDLDTRILQTEQRLVAREQKLRRGADALGRRIGQALQPWRRAMPAIGSTLALSSVAALAWWWWRRATPRAGVSPAAAQHAGDAATAGSAGDIPWVRLVALGWPLLPARWRERVSPATAGTLVAVGLPMVEWLLHGHKTAPPATMPAVDVERFTGRWFVVAQLPRRFGSAGLGTLQYTPRPDGQLEVVAGGSGAQDGDAPVRGVAQVLPGSGGAKWALSLWPAWLRALPPAWRDHWILHVDEAYSEALVGSARRDRLCLLSRQPRLAPQRLRALLQLAQDRGFAIERLRFVADA